MVRWFGPLILVASVVLAPYTARAAHDWNDGAVAWKGHDDGFALAKKEQKPLLLIVYTEWCPHCGNYSKVFHDPKVVEKAKQFVMVRLDQDLTLHVELGLVSVTAPASAATAAAAKAAPRRDGVGGTPGDFVHKPRDPKAARPIDNSDPYAN